MGKLFYKSDEENVMTGIHYRHFVSETLVFETLFFKLEPIK